MSSRWAENQSLMVRRFFLATVLQVAVCIAVAWSLALIFKAPPPSDRLRLPAAFQFCTVFLLLGSWFLHAALTNVKVERQARFRRALLLALGFATLFVGVQSFGMWSFLKGTTVQQTSQLNTHGFVFMFVAMHAMHFLIAQSVLMWVTLASFYDRYDHEYYFGVAFAAWFWHALGIVWLGILWVFTVAA
ncbi:hypothetical protein [Fuerstiella marisgermanici]|uniref:Heme-copper oxidase subunit III family profile domain-containing protein n=1 Tax=Fuerstiella marisgermanici TaxID=1891926 RepID=A0A1P8WPW0_9PLAN|nr:hypothetical protein [Fuerstiella marisgermanici]APZ96091.1 hypothetical protein Fuma_05759 [Fuerstiella marisgermanici]